MTTSSDTVTSGTTSTAAATDDIEKVDVATLPEDVAKAVKGFQGDYTKKMQALSEKMKEFEGKPKTAGDWNKWYSENQGLITEFNTWRAKAEEEDASVTKNVTDDDDDGSGAIKAVKQLEKNTNEKTRQMETVFAEGFQMVVQLHQLHQ